MVNTVMTFGRYAFTDGRPGELLLAVKVTESEGLLLGPCST